MDNHLDIQNVTLDVILPVYNEEAALPLGVQTLHSFLSTSTYPDWRITIVDNGSTDNTQRVARALVGKYPQVHAMFLTEKGRGRALKAAWLCSNAKVLSYMDIDLSTDLNSLPQMVDAIMHQGYDMAVGSRLAAGAKVTRTIRREIISRCYMLLIKFLFRTRFSDAQCGFKALSHGAARALLPHIRDNEWFLDTELLITAEKCGFRIKDVPVTWLEDPDSRVAIIQTAWRDLKGLCRLRFGGLAQAELPNSTTPECQRDLSF